MRLHLVIRGEQVKLLKAGEAVSKVPKQSALTELGCDSKVSSSIKLFDSVGPDHDDPE